MTITVILFFTVIFFNSCSPDVQNLNISKDYPASIIDNFRLINTDSTRVQIVISSKLHKDFSNKSFVYSEFPKGISVELFDSKNKKTTIQADTAMMYKASNIVELKGNVIIHTYDGKILKTPKLYWNQEYDWIFTEEPFSYTNPEDNTIMEGIGIDFDKNFTTIIAHKTTGIVAINSEDNNK